MELEEKIAVVTALGFKAEDAQPWFHRYRGQSSNATQRGLGSDLTFAQYMTKVAEAGLTQPENIGKSRGQFVLGRLGDIGGYSVNTCRFIPAEQNHREKVDNGKTIEQARLQRERMTGLTKETSEQVRKMAESQTGKTKANNPGTAAQAAKLAKNFVLTSPEGVVHSGSNVKEFCAANDLNVFAIYDVFAGRRQHHKGWTGHYS